MNKKKEIVRLAILGIASGLLCSSTAAQAETTHITDAAISRILAAGCTTCGAGGRKARVLAENENEHENKTPKPYKTAEELRNSLKPEAKKVYMDLDSAGQELALKLANQDCKGKNECKGQGGCKSADQAGKNECAGKGACDAFKKDPNLAVKVAAKKMAERRAQSTR